MKKETGVKRDHIIIREKIWVPLHLVNVATATEAYTKSFYADANCRHCEYLPERHSSWCDVCDNYQGTTKLYSYKLLDGLRYIGFPIGDKRNFERKTGILFEDVQIIDKRTQVPFEYPVKFLIDLYDYQKTATSKFLKKKYGLLESPPRTGKTAMALFIAISMGHRVLLLANQHEFLSQFLDHIHGNEKEGIPKCTNLPELEKKYKKKLYGFPKTDEDFENFQIMVMTYQGFISETRGLERFKKVSPHVGTVIIDEAHKLAAEKFSQVVSRFRSRYRFGVTATVTRKDKRDIILRNIVGPIVAKSTRETLTPTVWVHPTEFRPKSRYAGGKASWVFAMLALSKDKKRNKLIVDQVMRDLKAGYNIVIPVVFKKHVFELQRLINERWDDIKPGKRICEVFVGGGGKGNQGDRKDILARAKSGRTRVIVGIRSLLQLGLNVPAWSVIYTAMPISNEPNYRQETSRIRTPMEGKKSPIVRLFVDQELGQSLGCARNCLAHLKGFGYNFAGSPEQKALRSDILSSGRKRMTEEDFDAEMYKAQRTIPKALKPGLFSQGKKRL